MPETHKTFFSNQKLLSSCDGVGTKIWKALNLLLGFTHITHIMSSGQ